VEGKVGEGAGEEGMMGGGAKDTTGCPGKGELGGPRGEEGKREGQAGTDGAKGRSGRSRFRWESHAME